MERRGRAPVATFYAPELSGAGELSLSGAAAHHAGVRRLLEGDPVRVTNGAGLAGAAGVLRLGKGELVVQVAGVDHIPALPRLELLVPVADRDRMLWLAEKCAELAISVWQPVLFARSRSVSPRGEGPAFAAKVRARMIGALEQSGGAWLPDVRREVPLDEAAPLVTTPARYLLDRVAPPLDAANAHDGSAITFGPEGGVEVREQAILRDLGWRRAAIGPTTLRFETAGIAAVAILRAAVGRTQGEE